MTHADIFTRLSGTTGSSATGQNLASTTTAGVLSTNWIDLDAGGSLRTQRELRDLYALVWFTGTPVSATLTATMDIELVMQPYTFVQPSSVALTAFDNTTDVNATVITSNAHGMTNGTRVTVAQTSGTLNTGTGYAVSTVLYVVNATTNTYGLSATLGGSAISLTDQTGTTVVTYYPTGLIVFDNTKDVNGTVITYPNHGLPNGTRITVAQTLGTLNTGTGYAASKNLYIVNATTDTFGISTTPGGAAISLTDQTGVTTVTWFAEVVGSAPKIGLERLVANVAQVQFDINPLLLGPGNGVPVHRYLFARYTPSVALTSASQPVFCDIRSGAPMRNFPINAINYVTP